MKRRILEMPVGGQLRRAAGGERRLHEAGRGAVLHRAMSGLSRTDGRHRDRRRVPELRAIRDA